MTYYLLMPCKTTAAFISTLKKPRRVNLGKARRQLEAAGYGVEDLSVMLIVNTEPELTLYESGKTLIKTADADAARRAIDGVYQVLGIAESAAAGKKAARGAPA
ncbi:MAG: hypothetical protein AABY30_04275 [Candidatus Thermoplasmatota archaeon]